jgi:ornithine cyclodeaminase/alanine dehydrogenase-like protein (mu-crystallin family)
MSSVVVPALALTSSEVRALMSTADYLAAVELGFRALAEGRAEAPPPLGLELAHGGFHGKAAALTVDDRSYVALKFNGNFPNNHAERGLPTIQGTMLLCDGESGSLLAIMDSIEVTLRRTAAATALAAKHLARPSSETILICGCGKQASAQLDAMRAVLPLRNGLCWDRDTNRAATFARKYRSKSMTAVEHLADAAWLADVIVTCTTATQPFLTAGMVRPGTFIAAVGADNPRKSEIEPALMARALLVTDSTAQCAAMGDLRHAMEVGVMTAERVHAELAELVAGAKLGRTTENQLTLFDSTGVAVQDVASAVQVYQRALAAGARTRIALGV